MTTLVKVAEIARPRELVLERATQAKTRLIEELTAGERDGELLHAYLRDYVQYIKASDVLSGQAQVEPR